MAPEARVVILSETEKIASPGLMEEHPTEENDPAELTQAWRAHVKGADIIESASAVVEDGSMQGRVRVRNTYFEWIPAQFIQAYVTDEGLWSVEDIARRSNWISDEMDRVFKGL